MTTYIMSVYFSCSVLSNSLLFHGLQHARLPCPSSTHRAYSINVQWIGDAIQPFHPLMAPLLPSIFPSIRVFSNESVLCTRWPKYWNFSFGISPSNEYWRGLKNTNLLLYSSGGQKFQTDLPGLKSKFRLGCIPSRGSGENIFPDFFQFLEASFIPWFAACFSIFKINSKASSNLSLTQDPRHTYTSPSSTFVEGLL